MRFNREMKVEFKKISVFPKYTMNQFFIWLFYVALNICNLLDQNLLT